MRAILIMALFLFSLSVLTAQDIVYENPVVPLIPEVTSQGGSYTAIAAGYPSLFTNPAGFVSDKIDFSIITVNPWLYTSLGNFVSAAESLFDAASGTDISDFVNDQVVDSGFGFGMMTGISYVGKGLGLALFGMGDLYLYGDAVNSIEGEFSVTAGIIGGYAVPFKIGDMVLKVGGDLRPMVRLKVPLPNTRAVDFLVSMLDGGDDPFSLISTLDGYYGSALALDLGAILEFGSFSVGLSIRDLGNTEFFYSLKSVESHLDAISNGEIPDGNISDTRFIIPMEVSIGFAFHPDLGSLARFIDPCIHVDFVNPGSVFHDDASPWQILHAGAELKLLKFISARAGFYEGLLTFGAGLGIPVLDISLSGFTPLGNLYSGDRPSSGVSIEVAIRL
ncbi:MAG: hypothetical protein JW874_08295 [Spirochaetales bacterium]|nr:hypothetical protein [Spirochaetales bacterium]